MLNGLLEGGGIEFGDEDGEAGADGAFAGGVETAAEADGLTVDLDGAAGEEDGWDAAGFPFDLSGREEGFDEPAEVEEVGGGGVSGGP